jgi:hypothetical protein
MAAINQHGQLNSRRPAQVSKRIKCGADRAPAEEHVIHEHNGMARDVNGDVRWLHLWRDALVEVVAVHGNIERACGDGMSPDGFELGGEATGQRDAAPLNADQDNFTALFVSFGDLVGDARQHALQRGGIQ